MTTKICKKCGEEKPSTDQYFPKDKAMKDGFKNVCKECKRIYNIAYRVENKEKLTEYSRKNYQRNKERIINYKKVNKSKINDYRKKHYIENKEKIAAYGRDYRKQNEQVITINRKINRERNKPLNTYHEQKRRALKRQLPYTLTISEWEECVKYFDNRCCYCGVETEKFHQEHLIPLSKGGGYVKENIIPSCPTCNYSKNNKDFTEWYPKQLFYTEQRERKILDFVEEMKCKTRW